MGTPKVEYAVALMAADMAIKGWNNTALASKARVSNMSVGRFLKGEAQTAKMAFKLAKALGHPVSRYVVSPEAMAS